MFVKVPVYFDLQGSLTKENISFFQEILQTWVEKQLLGRKAKEAVTLPGAADLKKFGVDPEVSAFLVKRDKVIDSLR